MRRGRWHCRRTATLLVLGTAADPREYLIQDYSLEPHYYLAVMRLHPDGTLDRTFGREGRRVFRVGEQYYGMEYDVNSASAILQVARNGRIYISYHANVPVAVLSADGFIESVNASAPAQDPVARELEVVLEFIDDAGQRLLAEDADEAVALDRGGKWYRTGQAFTKSAEPKVPSP
jgi:hypothetical protein